MKKKYVSRLLAGCLTVTMLTPTGALASVPQPVVTQEASQEAGQENETENKEQAEEYAADSAAEVQTDETETAENRTAADKSREQIEPQTAQTGEQAEPQTTQTGEQAASEAEPQAQVQPRAVVAVKSVDPEWKPLVVPSCRRKLYHQWMGSDQRSLVLL